MNAVWAAAVLDWTTPQTSQFLRRGLVNFWTCLEVREASTLGYKAAVKCIVGYLAKPSMTRAGRHPGKRSRSFWI